MSGEKWIERTENRAKRGLAAALRPSPLHIVVDERALARWLAQGAPASLAVAPRGDEPAQAERCTSGWAPCRSESSVSNQLFR